MSETENGFRAPLPEELAPFFPSYRIESLIATGGMGAVYHAIQTSLDREVAIKILPVEFGKDPEFCKSFEAEAKVMARLNHPNLIGVYDFGSVNGMLFIVMEYVPGNSVHEASNGAAVDPAEVVRLMTGICHGLAHAHEYGILHGDIKPANILIDIHLHPKIGDFGLARPLDAQIKEGDAIFGTPGYTAPEVLVPPHKVDQRADIFSLGVLLHELLAGVPPGSDPRPPSAIAHCDPRFDAVVQKATHPNPALRYQNAREIADALQTISTSAGPKVLRTASPAGKRAPVRRVSTTQVTKSGSGGMVVTLLAVVGLVALVVFLNNLSGSDPEPVPPVGENQQEQKPDPGSGSVTPEPGPVVPGPDTVGRDPGPLAVEPDAVKTDSDPWESKAGTTGSDGETFNPEPGPVAVTPGPGPVNPGPETVNPGPDPVNPGATDTLPKAKFDVDGFLGRARSVMIGRCGADITKHHEALKQNLKDFNTDAWKLVEQNLELVHHTAARRELDEFLDKCADNGNRIGEGLEKPLKHKKYLVELHKQYQGKEASIEDEFKSALIEHEKTYLQGLGIKVKALETSDDPAALELIKAEVEKVKASHEYFAGLMMDDKED